MKTKIITLMAMIFLLGSHLVRADLVFDSGYNTFDDDDPYYAEVWVINDAHLDVLGGSMGKLELTDFATANLYDGQILSGLYIQDTTTVSIHGAAFDIFAAGEDSQAYLYAYDVTYHPTGGLGDEGWIEGTYYSNDTPFTFSFYTEASYSHINIVPEPCTLVLVVLGGLISRNHLHKTGNCNIILSALTTHETSKGGLL